MFIEAEPRAERDNFTPMVTWSDLSQYQADLDLAWKWSGGDEID